MTLDCTMGDESTIQLEKVTSFHTAKNVRFDDRTIVHYENEWSCDDYRVARMGPWMTHAIDRFRFKRRIDDFERRFAYIFTKFHHDHIRNRVWK